MRTPLIPFALALLCACPIPIPSDTVTRPAISFLVHDATDLPIPNARVLLLTASDPHGRIEGLDETTTDADGRATFTERIETITQFPLMMHGVAFYRWSWCIETPHPTAITSAVQRDDRMTAERHPPHTGLRVRYAQRANATTDTLEDTASSIRTVLSRRSDELPKTFAFSVRVEADHMIVDLGGLDADAAQKLVDAITNFSSAQFVDSAPFGAK